MKTKRNNLAPHLTEKSNMKFMEKFFVSLLGFLGLILLMVGCTGTELRTDIIALKGFQIITLEDENVEQGKILVIKNDLILDILPEGRFYEKYNLPDSLIVDGKGKFLMPSLNEMHAHFQPDNPAHKTYLSHFLGYGITNVRVMAGSEKLLSWKDSIQQGLLLGPDLKVAGPLIDGDKPLWGEGHTGPVVSDVSKVDSIVSSHKAAGYDLIKLYERLPKDVYMEFLIAAENHKIMVAGHIPFSLVEEINLKEIFNSNSPGFEHFSNFGALVTKKNKTVTKQPGDMAYYKKEMAEDPDPAKIKEVVSEIAKNNVWLCPTSVLWRNNIDSLRQQAVIEGEPFQRIDSGLKNWWLSTRSQPSSGKEAALSGLFLKEMAKQNTKILAGTDFPMPFLVPGYSLHQEIHSLVDMGYSNLEALKSATVYPAEYWDESEMRGNVRTGSLANLIVLNENPLEDIRNTLTIDQIIFKGDFFNPTDLLKFPDNFN